MNRTVFKRILEEQEKLYENPEYQKMQAEHELLNARFLEQLETMNESQRSAVWDYFGLLIEMHLKTLEFCLR